MRYGRFIDSKKSPRLYYIEISGRCMVIYAMTFSVARVSWFLIRGFAALYLHFSHVKWLQRLCGVSKTLSASHLFRQRLLVAILNFRDQMINVSRSESTAAPVGQHHWSFINAPDKRTIYIAWAPYWIIELPNFKRHNKEKATMSVKSVIFAFAFAVVAVLSESPFRFKGHRDSLRNWQDPKYRLPRDFLPTSYAIRLLPFIEEDTVDGQVSVFVECVNSTNSITLNSLNISIDSSKITVTFFMRHTQKE